uniref:NECAP PHear domain-containing protein n=1 Tax=Anas platyrhynchos platyrhynchos TaxID=8840 RepID=A0A493T7N9_ANAPP
WPPPCPHRAAEWQLERPAWSGRLRLTARGSTAFIRLEDRASGELFAQAPVEQFPSIAVESVTDSSRYFVIRIEDENGVGEAAERAGQAGREP